MNIDHFPKTNLLSGFRFTNYSKAEEGRFKYTQKVMESSGVAKRTLLPTEVVVTYGKDH